MSLPLRLQFRRSIFLLLGVFFFVLFFSVNSSKAAIREELNFVSKIVNVSGTNITTGSPACVVSGVSNDTCDFWFKIYDASGGGTLLWDEIQTDIEVGSYDGIFSVNLGSVTSLNDVDLQGFDRNDLYIQVEFDPSGNGDFSEGETFSPRKALSAVPYAFNSKYLGGRSSSGYVQVSPAASQATGDVTTSLLWLNENGSGTPNLLELEVGGADRLVLSNAGNLTISVGDLFIGSIGLNDLGTGPTDSGGSLIGLFDEFANSNSTNLQDILDDLDAAISASAAGDITAVIAGSGLTGGGITGDVTLDIGAGDGISVAGDSIAVDATVLRTTTNFGGDVSGVYSAIALGSNTVSDSEIDYATVTLSDFTNDSGYYSTSTDSYLFNTSDTGDLTLTSTTTQDQYKFNLTNNTSSGTQNILVLDNSGSGTTEALLSLINSGTLTNLISAANFIVTSLGDITTSGGDILGANSKNIDIGEANSGGITLTGDLYPNADDTYDIGSTGLRWQDGYYVNTLNIGSTLTLSDSGILDTNGNINLQAGNDTDDFVYIDTTTNASNIYWEGVLAYTNDPGLRVNGTGQIEYRDEDSSSWVAFDSIGGGGLFSNNATVADGSYVEVAHNQNTNNLLSSGWVYDSGASEWRSIEDSVEGVGSHTTADGNLEGWWKGEESSGTLLDETSNDNDLVNGNGNSAASYSNVGARANTVKFDGSNDYFSVADSASLSPTSAVSVGGWIKLDDSFSAYSEDHDYGIIDKGDYRLYLDRLTGKVNFEINDSAATSWSVIYTGANSAIQSFAVYNGKMYAGRSGALGLGDVLVYTGAGWVVSFDGGQEEIRGLGVYDGKLYAGQGSSAGDGDVYVFDGVSWQLSYNGTDTSVFSFVEYRGKLYAGEASATGVISVFDGSTWSTSYDSGSGTIYDLMEFNGYLYAVASGGTSHIYICDPGTTGDANTCDSGDWVAGPLSASTAYQTLVSFNGVLYAGQGNAATVGDLYVCNPATAGNATTCDNASDWTISYNGGQEGIFSSVTYNGKLYISAGISAGDGDVFVCDPTLAGDAQLCDNASDWSTSYDNGTTLTRELTEFDGKIYAGLQASESIATYGNNKVTSSVKNNWEGGKWYHVAATYDTSTDTANIYVNGTLDIVNSATMTTTAIEDGNTRLYFGSMAGKTGESVGDGLFKGAIDEGFVYSDVLTSSEIANLGNRVEPFKVVQVDANTVRLYNNSGTSKDLRLNVASGSVGTNAAFAAVELTNKSGGSVAQYAVVIADSANDNAFTTTTTVANQKVIGVMTDGSCAVDAVCTVQVSGKSRVTANEAITRGEYLYTSSTAGEAKGESSPSTGLLGIALSGDAVPTPYQVDLVIIPDTVGGLFSDGTNGVYYNTKPIIVGGDVAFSYVGTPSGGDMRIADDFESVGDGYVGANLVVGASTSATETIGNAGFVMGGDDLFVAGMFGVEGNIYTDGDLTIQSDIDTTGAGDVLLNFGGTNSEILGWSASLDAFTLTDDFLPSVDNTSDLGSVANRWKDGYFSGTVNVGSTLQLSDSFIRDTNGRINLQPNNDSDDHLYIETTTNVTGVFWEGVLAYTNDPGLRTNGATGEMEYRDEDSGTWVPFDSLTTAGGVYSNNGTVSDGSYLEITHSEATNNLLVSGWVYDTGTTEWRSVSESILALGTHVTSDGNLEGWWKGEEASGTLNDETSNNNDLVNGNGSSAASYSNAGARGNAIKLDGTNDYFSVADSATLSPTSTVSVGGWIKLDDGFGAYSSDTDYGIIDKGDYRLYLSSDTGKLTFEVNDSAATSWTTSYDGAGSSFAGFGTYNGKLYAGQGGGGGAGDVYVFDGNQWVLSFDTVLGHALAFAVYEGKLYVGFGAAGGMADVYVFDGVSWKLSYDGAEEQINSLVVYNGKLYGGQGFNAAGDGDVVMFDGATWTTSYAGAEEIIRSLVVYNGKLYAGQASGTGDGDIFVCTPSTSGAVNDCDNADWVKAYEGTDEAIRGLGVYDGKLYAGNSSGAGSGDVFVCTPSTAGASDTCDNASDWATSYEGAEEFIFGFSVYNGKLYAGQGNGVGDGDVLEFDGSSWTTSYAGSDQNILALVTYNGKLYAAQDAAAAPDGDIFVYGNNKVTSSVKNSWEGGKWYHVAATYDTSTDTSKVYVDGILDSTNSATTNTTAIEDGNARLYYGTNAGSTGAGTGEALFKGAIDEGFVYSDVLTATEVANLGKSYEAYKIVQTDNNTVRLYNYSGVSQDLRMSVATEDDGIAGFVTRDPEAADIASDTNGHAIWVDKTGEGGNILSIESDGSNAFSVDSEGNVQIGDSTLDDVDVNLYGDIFEQANKDLTGMSAISDVFVYDTTKDIDKGAWTNSSTSQQLSWYTETKDDGAGDLCVVGTDDRCGRSEFPKKTVVVATATGVHIFDAQSNKLWMSFTQTGTFSLGADTNNNPSSVFALNGVIYVGTNGSSGSGLYAIDFKGDKIYRYDATDRKDTGTSTVDDRNTVVTYGNSVTVYAINSAIVNDVHATVVAGETLIGVATDVDMSVIKPYSFIVRDYSDNSGDDYNNVWITRSGRLYGLNETAGQLEKWNNINTDVASEIAGTPDKVWDEASTPALSATAPTIQITAGSLFVEENYSNNSDKIYVGTDKGATIVSDRQSDESNGSVKYYTKDYISEEMIGDIRGMWPLYGTPGAAITDGTNNIDDASSKATEVTAKNANGTGMSYVSGVRGTGVDFDGADDYLCSDINDDGTCDTDADIDLANSSFSVGGWVKRDTTGTADYFIGVGSSASVNNWLSFGFAASDVLICSFFSNNLVSSTTFTDTTNWHHLVCTYNAGTNERAIYVDGVFVTSDIAPADFQGTADLEIGRGAGANYTDGKIDEAFVTAETLRPDQIKSMYASGRGALKYRTISVTDATSATSTTIVDSSETWTPNEFVGAFVEITGGTGIGQTRKITLNTATSMTVSPAWTSTPSTDSDFAVDPEKLYGATDTTYAVGVGSDSSGESRTLYIGTNDTSDGGGVTALDLGSDTVTDIYQGLAGRTDDSGAAWNTTTDYDDITSLSVGSDVLAIGTGAQYWMEFTGKSFTEKVDSLTNEVNGLQNALPGVLTDTSRQDNTTNSSVGYQIVRKGWGYIVGDGTTKVEETVNFGTTFDDAPLVFFANGGFKATTAPASLQECVSEAATVVSSNVTDITYSTYLANLYGEIGTTLSASNYYCYSWVAIGTSTGGSVANAYGSYSGGADLAENYRTYDMEVESGSVVGIDSERDIAVERTSKAYDSGQIGIVATKPGIVLGPSDGSTPGTSGESTGCTSSVISTEVERSIDSSTSLGMTNDTCKVVEVALAGRVPVKVSLENGSIKRGDFLTASSTAGVAMKATKAGAVIGRALENFDGKSTLLGISNDVPNESDLNNYISEQENFSELGINKTATGKVMAFVQTGYYWGDSETDSVSQLGQLDTTYDGILTTEEVGLASEQENLVNAILNGQTDSEFGGSRGGSINKLIVPEGGQVVGTFRMGGTLLNQLDSSLSSVGSVLKLQSQSDEDIDIFNGNILILSEGTLRIKGTLEAGEINASSLVLGSAHLSDLKLSNQSINSGEISAGETEVRIENSTAEEGSKVILTPESLISSALIVKETGEGYFVVSISEKQNSDIEFTYLIINNKIVAGDREI